MKLFLLIALLIVVPTVRSQGVVRIQGPTTATAGSTLLTSLSASWKFDESSGNAADSSGNGTTFTNNNTVTYNTGLINNAGYLVGASSQYFSATSNSFIQAGDVDFSIAFNFFIAGVDFNDLVFIVSKRSATAGASEYSIHFAGTSDHTIRFNVFKATDSPVEVSSGSVTSDVWHTVVVWHNAATNEIGVSLDDATPVTQATGGSLQAAASAPLYVAQSGISGTELYYTGRVDNLNIWKKVLTSTERTCFYNSAASAQYPFTGLCP